MRQLHFFSNDTLISTLRTEIFNKGATSLEERFNLRYAQSLKSFELKKGELYFKKSLSALSKLL
jgi:hypothetical protein